MVLHMLGALIQATGIVYQAYVRSTETWDDAKGRTWRWRRVLILHLAGAVIQMAAIGLAL